MKQAAQLSVESAQTKTRPTRSRSSAAAFSSAGAISQLASAVNASPRVQKLTDLATAINQPTLLRKRAPEEEKLLQGRFDPMQRKKPEEELQRKQASPSSPTQLEAAPSNNHTGLPDQLKSGIESLSGISMDGVNVHYNSSQPAQLNALAYAQGTDIHVASGQEKHLPHEAWHVVQQAQGRVRPTMQMKNGTPVNDDTGLEHEADVMGQRALSQPQTALDPAQLQCAACKEEKDTPPAQRTAVVQRYTECSESDHYTDRYHYWIQRRYKSHFGSGSWEFSVTKTGDDKKKHWNFIDIADVSDKEVYEIKSEGQGAASAAQEAQYYVNLLNSDEGCKGDWSLGRTFSKVWHTEGGGERLRAWSPRKGAILYSITEVPLTPSSSEADTDMDDDSGGK